MRAIGLLFAGVVVLSAVGCGSSGKAKVEGQVTKNGAPLALAEGESVMITLTSEDGKSTYTAGAAPDGTFSVQQPAGGPIPAGKYKVHCVYQLAPSPYTKKAGFKVVKDLPEPWDVSANSSFTVDVGK
jgi:hypothetical protein